MSASSRADLLRLRSARTAELAALDSLELLSQPSDHPSPEPQAATSPEDATPPEASPAPSSEIAPAPEAPTKSEPAPEPAPTVEEDLFLSRRRPISDVAALETNFAQALPAPPKRPSAKKATATPPTSSQHNSSHLEVVRRELTNPFGIQLPEPIDAALRDEVVRRTALLSRKVFATEILLEAFSPSRLPETAAAAEALVASVPGPLLNGSYSTMTVRLDPEIRLALERVGSLLFQARSKVRKRDVYGAVLAMYLGLMPLTP